MLNGLKINDEDRRWTQLNSTQLNSSKKVTYTGSIDAQTFSLFVNTQGALEKYTFNHCG